MPTKKFNDIEEMLDFLPSEERRITACLMQIIESCIPNFSCKLSYNVPFYSRHKNICFIWPSSVLWGNKKSYSGVRLGFTKGYLMLDELNYLDKGERKEVFWKDFGSIDEIDIPLLKTYLFEAVSIDNQFSK